MFTFPTIWLSLSICNLICLVSSPCLAFLTPIIVHVLSNSRGFHHSRCPTDSNMKGTRRVLWHPYIAVIAYMSAVPQGCHVRVFHHSTVKQQTHNTIQERTGKCQGRSDFQHGRRDNGPVPGLFVIRKKQRAKGTFCGNNAARILGRFYIVQ